MDGCVKNEDGSASLGRLGDFSLHLARFPNLEKALSELEASFSPPQTEKDRLEKIHTLLLNFIHSSEMPCFLLGAVGEFIDAVSNRNWVESYKFSHFEFWLNQMSGLSAQDNYLVRAKIMGRYIPREAYQTLFPIGMGKTYMGSHYVTAHGSPDLDTTVASFWGWVDAFSARVSKGLHIWNVPGGPPGSQIEILFLFNSLIGEKCFEHFAKTRTTLALSAVDLVTQSGLVKKGLDECIRKIDEDKSQNAIVLVDEAGCYLGDWRQSDGEGFRKITMLFSSCLRWFISFFQQKLMRLFSQDVLSRKSALLGVEEIFSCLIVDSEPAKGFTEKQKRKINNYLLKVLHLEKGWNSSFKEFWVAMNNLSLKEFAEFEQVLSEEFSPKIFDKEGNLLDNRACLFQAVEKIVNALEKAVYSLREHVDQFGIALAIKKEVFGYSAQVISHRAEVEEIRGKMGSFSYLTVTMPDSDGKDTVIGIIKASDVAKVNLGTVSLRDFCNRDETKIPSYFEVISVIDHHKSSLSTTSAPVAWIADAQSANALVAEVAFSIHDQYGTAGLSAKNVETQLGQMSMPPKGASEGRVMQKLIQKQMIHAKKGSYFIDSKREYLEYLHYLYAILDDTDLLSKVSYRDVVCVASLLNRMKTLMLGQEAEVISFDDLVCNEEFASVAARRILQNDDMYSLYKKIYASKEEAVDQNLRFCVQGNPSNVFADTKVQNGCNRVGQTKLFEKNFSSYREHAEEIRALWCEEARNYYEERRECDLHMHMISTVPSADDVYAGKEGVYTHKDELWIWIPQEESAIAHLKSFLHAFSTSPQIVDSEMEVEFLESSAKLLKQVFHESFKSITEKSSNMGKKISAPVAILHYRAGLLNSRKAMISPYLPKLI